MTKTVRAMLGWALSLAVGMAWIGAEDDAPKAWDPALGTAELRGTVVFEGSPPPRATIPVDDERCRQSHDGPFLSESVIVGEGGALRNTFVWVRTGLGKWKFPGPDQPARLDQKGCVFAPHVVGLQVGQPLLVRNSDPCAHNVHALPRRNSEFNFGQPREGTENMITFVAPEIGIRIRCDVHGWMGAWACVVEHPYFAVTGDDGKFRLPGLPPGEYVIEAWHESLGVRTQTVTLSDEQAADVNFAFAAK